MSKYTILLLFLLGSVSVVKAQYFSKRYPLTLAGYISSIQIVDDTIYAMCQVADTAPPYKNVGDFVKIDKDGNIISQSFFDIPSKTNIGMNFDMLIRTNDGGFAYAGWAWDTTAFQSILLVKYDRSGNYQWYREIQDTNHYSYYCLGIIQDTFSNFYFTGLTEDKVNGHTYTYLTKLDSSGNQIYSKILGDSTYEHNAAVGICINHSGHIVIGGNSGNTNTQDYSTYEGYMLAYELDTGGRVLKRVVNSNPLGPSIGFIYPLSDGGYLTASGYICSRTVSSVHSQGSIAKLDSNFNIVWQIDTGACSLYTSFDVFSKNQSGQFIAGGDYQDLTDTVFDHHNGWLMKVGEDGNLKFDKMYRGFSDWVHLGDLNSIRSIGFLSNGDIIGAGEASDGANVSHAQQGWLLRLDSLGCMPDSTNCGVVNGISEISIRPGAHLFPNPSSTYITIQYAPEDNPVKITITNILGQIAYENILDNINAEETLQVSSWASGLYSCRLMSKDNKTSSYKFLVTH